MNLESRTNSSTSADHAIAPGTRAGRSQADAIAPATLTPEAANATPTRPSRRESLPDVSGFGVFSNGDAGQAHVMAHQLLDRGNDELGHRWLGSWLARNDGRGSDWTHLQWHMGVFELKLGHWDAALARFHDHILPVAATTDDALTDAPAMLWRLQLSADGPVVLPWEPVRTTAARALPRESDPYVALHCILALAGGGDLDAIDRWMDDGRQGPRGHDDRLLRQLASGIRAYSAAEYRLAATALGSRAPDVSRLGGSHAQNELFRDIADRSRQLADGEMDHAA